MKLSATLAGVAYTLALATAANDTNTTNLAKRSDVDCRVPGWGSAGSQFILEGIDHLRHLNCFVAANSVSRVSCSYGSGIYMAAGQDTWVACAFVGERAKHILDVCCTDLSCQWKGGRGKSFQGQDFGEEYKVFIAGTDC